MKKRVISLLLALCVASGMLTAPVYAEATVQEEIQEQKSGGGGDESDNIQSQNLQVLNNDLPGEEGEQGTEEPMTIEEDGGAGEDTVVGTGEIDLTQGSVVITDTGYSVGDQVYHYDDSFKGESFTIDGKDNTATGNIITVNKNCTITLKNVTIGTDAANTGNRSPLTIGSGCNVNLKIDGEATLGAGWDGCHSDNIVIGNGSSLTVNGGTLSCKENSGHSKISMGSNASMTVESGTVDLRSSDGASTISGNGTFTVKGGTVKLRSDPWDDYETGVICDGNVAFVIDNGTVKIYQDDFLIGNKKFSFGGNSLTVNGGKLTSELASFTLNQAFTLNGGSIELAGNIADAVKNNSKFAKGLLTENNNVTVYGESTLTEDFTLAEDKTLKISAGVALTVGAGTTLTNYGTINVENNGTLAIVGDAENKGNGTLYVAEGGTVSKKKAADLEDWKFSGIISDNSIEFSSEPAGETGIEYSVSSDSGRNYTTQTSPKFEGLKADTEYKVKIKLLNNDYYEERSSNVDTVHTGSSGSDETVCGNYTITGNFTLEEGETLTIPAGATLTVAEGAALTNNGIIKVENGGVLTIEGDAENTSSGQLHVVEGGKVNKKAQDKPDIWNCDISTTDTTITFSAISGGKNGVRYSVDGGKTYQETPTFDNLSPNTSYELEIMYPGNDYYDDSFCDIETVWTDIDQSGIYVAGADISQGGYWLLADDNTLTDQGASAENYHVYYDKTTKQLTLKNFVYECSYSDIPGNYNLIPGIYVPSGLSQIHIEGDCRLTGDACIYFHNKDLKIVGTGDLDSNIYVDNGKLEILLSGKFTGKAVRLYTVDEVDNAGSGVSIEASEIQIGYIESYNEKGDSTISLRSTQGDINVDGVFAYSDNGNSKIQLSSKGDITSNKVSADAGSEDTDGETLESSGTGTIDISLAPGHQAVFELGDYDEPVLDADTITFPERATVTASTDADGAKEETWNSEQKDDYKYVKVKNPSIPTNSSSSSSSHKHHSNSSNDTATTTTTSTQTTTAAATTTQTASTGTASKNSASANAYVADTASEETLPEDIMTAGENTKEAVAEENTAELQEEDVSDAAENDKKTTTSAGESDSSGLLLWIALSVAAAGLLFILLYKRRKKDEE